MNATLWWCRVEMLRSVVDEIAPWWRISDTLSHSSKDDRNLKMFYNGSSMGVVAIGTAELDWCSHISSAYQSTQSLKQCIGFPSALSDDDCEALTTL